MHFTIKMNLARSNDEYEISSILIIDAIVVVEEVTSKASFFQSLFFNKCLINDPSKKYIIEQIINRCPKVPSPLFKKLIFNATFSTKIWSVNPYIFVIRWTNYKKRLAFWKDKTKNMHIQNIFIRPNKPIDFFASRCLILITVNCSPH